MPNKPSKEAVRTLVVMRERVKRDFDRAVEILNELNPGANYNRSSLISALMKAEIARVKVLAKKNGIEF